MGSRVARGGRRNDKARARRAFDAVAMVATLHGFTLGHMRMNLQVHLSVASLNCRSAVATMRAKSSCTHSTTRRQDL